jgi:hypothetical protein
MLNVLKAFQTCFRLLPCNKPKDTYECAGCIFTDGTHVLAGHQPLKKIPIISGFGGKKLSTESNPIDTALRETIEELFHVGDVDPEIIDDIKGEIQPKRTIVNGSYHAFVYSLTDLERILYVLRLNLLKTPLYPGVPGNLQGLLFQRAQDPSAEVLTLCLLPVGCLNVCKLFQEDMKKLGQGA